MVEQLAAHEQGVELRAPVEDARRHWCVEQVQLLVRGREPGLVEVAQDGSMNLVADVHPLGIVPQPVAKQPNDPVLAAACDLDVRSTAGRVGCGDSRRCVEQDALGPGWRPLVAEQGRYLVAPSL